MQVIRVTADTNAAHLVELLSQRFELLSSLSMSARCKSVGDIVYVECDKDQYVDLKKQVTYGSGRSKLVNGCSLTPITCVEGPKRSLLRLCVTSAVARIIRERIAVDYMSDRIDKICGSFTTEEKARILNDTIRAVYAGEIYQDYYQLSSINDPILATADLQNDGGIKVDYVFTKLYEYLSINNELSVDGFVQFRLRSYFSRLNKLIYRTVDDFLFDQQYEEFVKLLSHFVDIQQPRIDMVTVARDIKGYLKFYDTKGEKIDTDHLLGDLGDLPDGDLNVEDILIGLLIALAPGKVLICMRGGRLLFETTINVFKGRVLVCDACSSCRLFTKDTPTNIH